MPQPLIEHQPALPDGALAFARDLPKAEINLLDGGHFLLESRLTEVVALIRPFLERHLARAAEPVLASLG